MVVHFIWIITVIIINTSAYIHTYKPPRKSGIILTLSLLHKRHLVVVSILKSLPGVDNDEAHQGHDSHFRKCFRFS
jgi:hypothetical protein